MTINKPSMKESKETQTSRHGNDHCKQTEQSSSSERSSQRGKPPAGHRRSPSPLALQPLRENQTIYSRFYHGEDGDIVAAEYWASPSDELYQECRTYFTKTNIQLDRNDKAFGQAYLRVPETSDEPSRTAAGDSGNKAPRKNKSLDLTKDIAQ